MGTLSHHQTKANEFLHRADRAITTHDSTEAAVALRRAASHITTALAVHQGWKHKSRRQLENVLQIAVSFETLSRSHLKTFRQTHTLAAHLAKPPDHPEPVASRAANPAVALRRMRRRVASLITHTGCLIAGEPKPVRHHKLWLRKPDLPIAPDFTCIQDILQLPNYEEIRQKFRLHRIALAADPDPHGWYERGDTPRRCPCHAELWNKPRDPHRITLSPLWQRALQKTFRIRLPNQLQLSC